MGRKPLFVEATFLTQIWKGFTVKPVGRKPLFVEATFLTLMKDRHWVIVFLSQTSLRRGYLSDMLGGG